MTMTVRPEGMPWMIPYLIVADAEQAASFYQKTFGFEVLNQAPDDTGKIIHAELRYKDMVIMCGSENAWGNPAKTPAHGKFLTPISLYIYCDDVDAMFEKVKGNVDITLELQDTFWGDRMFAVKDKDGHQWTFATFFNKQPE